MKKFATLVLVFGTCALTNSVSLAQSPFGQGISAFGVEEVTQPAQKMRMKMKIEGKGKDFKAAMEAVAKKRKKAQIKLEKLGAIPESIVFTEISAGESGGTSEMITRMQRSFGDDPRVAKMMKLKPPVVLSVSVTADWKLEGEGDDLILSCDQQQKEITDADLGGKSDSGELSEEQEELAEELAQFSSQYGYSSNEQAAAGEGKFYYVAKFEKSQIEEAGKLAFKQAKAKAENLATVAEIELGSLSSLARSANPLEQIYNSYGGGRSLPSPKTLDDGGQEVTSENPLKVKLTAQVYASFEIKR